MVALTAVLPRQSVEQQWQQQIDVVNLVDFIVLGFILVSPNSSNFNPILYTNNFEAYMNIILTTYLVVAIGDLELKIG